MQGVAGFFVTAKQLLGVLGRGQGRVQLDLQGRRLRIIEIGQVCYCLSPFDQVQVCEQHLPSDPVILDLLGIRLATNR